MSLLSMWRSDTNYITPKSMRQLVAFSGDGKLRDGSLAVEGLRKFLAVAPSKLLVRYVEEVLAEDSWDDGGLAFQELVNQLGIRLGFEVRHGRYRGNGQYPWLDGLWMAPEGFRILQDSKLSASFQFQLDRAEEYRGKESEQTKGPVSLLYVVGRGDCTAVEQQIRGSPSLWTTRIVSVKSLLRLVGLVEDSEDPEAGSVYRSILRPQDYIRVDGIVDWASVVAGDAVPEPAESLENEGIPPSNDAPSQVTQHREEGVRRIQAALDLGLVQRSRARFSTPKGNVRVVCCVSKEHGGAQQGDYRFVFHLHQREWLEQAGSGYVALVCGGPCQLVLIPMPDFLPSLDSLRLINAKTSSGIGRRRYWHLRVLRDASNSWRIRQGNGALCAIDEYVLGERTRAPSEAA